MPEHLGGTNFSPRRFPPWHQNMDRCLRFSLPLTQGRLMGAPLISHGFTCCDAVPFKFTAFHAGCQHGDMPQSR